MSGTVSSTSSFPTQVPFGPLVDIKTGRTSTEWLLFFNQMFKRIGAETGFNSNVAMTSDDQLQRTITTIQGNVTLQTAELTALVGDYDTLMSQLVVLQAQVVAQGGQIELALAGSAAASDAADEALIALFEG